MGREPPVMVGTAGKEQGSTAFLSEPGAASASPPKGDRLQAALTGGEK